MVEISKKDAEDLEAIIHRYSLHLDDEVQHYPPSDLMQTLIRMDQKKIARLKGVLRHEPTNCG